MNKSSLKLIYTLAMVMLFHATKIKAQQVPLTTVIEHFTNTKCSICKSKNPGLHTNLVSHPQVMHLSIHPSSPYSTCILSQQNTAANDARTNFYGIYGGTPRIVINGNVIPSNVNFSDTALFTPYLNQSSAFELSVISTYSSPDTLTYTITITKKDNSNFSTVSLFSGASEDTVFVNGGNGELEHYNVSRFAVQEFIMLPLLLNDSIIITRKAHVKSFWDKMRMYSFAMIQDQGTKQLIQAGQSSLTSLSLGVASLTEPTQLLKLYPVPSKDIINIEGQENFHFTIYDSALKQQSDGYSNRGSIDIRQLKAGLYALKIKKSNNYYYAKFIKQ